MTPAPPPSGSPMGPSAVPPPPGAGSVTPPAAPVTPPALVPAPIPEKPPTPALNNLWAWAKGYVRNLGWTLGPVWLAASDLPGTEAEDEGIVGCCCPDGEACTRWGRHLVSGLGIAHDEHEVEKVWPTSNPHVMAGHIGIAAMTGSDSGMFVMDVGGAGTMTRARFKITGHVLTQHTPSGGQHWFFSIDRSEAVYGSRKAIELVTGVLVLGDGGFVVVGPRVGYNWAGGSSVLAERGLTDPPDSLRLALGREKLIKPKGTIHRDDAWRTAPGSPLVGVEPRSYTRLGDIRRLVDHHGHIMTWTPGLSWRVWTAGGWGNAEASGQQIKSFVADLPELHRTEAVDLLDRGEDAMAKTATKYSNVSSNYATSRVMADLESDNRILVPSANDWDSEGHICGLPVVGGVGRLVNLRTGDIERDQISRRVSRQLGAEYDAGPGGTFKHLWDRGASGGPGRYFHKYLSDLERMYGPDWVRLLQRAAGSSLYGRRGVDSEDTVFCLKGATRTGKSTFVECLLACAGSYAKAMGHNLLFGDKGNPEYADAAVHGFRIMSIAEPPMGEKLNTTRLKALSGGDTITGRLPYARSEISFQPEVTLWLSTNHALEVSDDAVWRRLRFFTFSHSFEEGVDEMPGLRKAVTQDSGELQLALSWMLLGARDWYEEGWGDTTVWREAGDDERAKHDVKEKWAADCLEVTGSVADAFTLGDLMTSFSGWLAMSGETAPGLTKAALRDELEGMCVKKGLNYDRYSKKLTNGRLVGMMSM
jgi:hypothetical protein